MAKIHNIRLDDHFTMLSNRTPEDPNLTWAAKGLLWYLLSRDKNWTVHVWQLAKIYEGGKKGGKKDAIQELLKELRLSGYVEYIKSRNALGEWVHSYYVYPIKIKQFKEMFPERDHPATGCPSTGNPVISPSTELPSTELPRKYPKSSSSEEIPIPTGKKNDDDDSGKNIGENIWYRRTSGQMKNITQSEIYRHFLKLPFSTETLNEAISRFKSLTSPINTPFKYIESICVTVDKEKEDKPSKAKESQVKDQPQESTKIKQETITLGEYLKCRNKNHPFPSGKA
jgi:hypothetical protein